MSNNGTLIKVREPLLYFDNVNIESEAGADDLLKSLKNDINILKGKFLALGMSTPRDIAPTDYDSPVDFIEERVDEYFSDLYDLMYDYYSTVKIQEIIDSWKYSWNDNPMDIYDNCKDEAELHNAAFPEDYHEKIDHNMTHFSFAPNDNTILDALSRSVRNIKANDSISDFISNKYIIFENGKVFSSYDGRFLFKTIEDAEKVLEDKLDLHIIEYISKDFIESHPDFYQSVINEMKNSGFDKKKIKIFDDSINNFTNGDGKYNQEIIESLYNIFKEFYLYWIYKTCNIRIIKLVDLVNE